MSAEVSEGALPSKQEVLSFQDRWTRPAGYAALAGAFVSVAAVGIQQIGLNFPTGDSTADQLAFVHDHSGRLIIASTVQAIGVALFALPLTFLFKAARGRAQRMRGGFVGLVIGGPLVLGIGLILISVGGRQVSNDFAARAPGAEQHARQQAQTAAAAAAKQAEPAPKTKGAARSGSTTAATTTTTSSSVTTTPLAGTTTAPAGTGTTAANLPTPDQAARNAREHLADDVNKHSTLLSIAQVFQLAGVLSILFAFVYVPLWAMRTGLLTKGWGYVGIAAGVFLIFPVIPKFSGLVAVIWFAVLGLMFLGVWTRPLPPAWAAGKAIPWPRPGDDIGPPPERPGTGGTVEGSGREVSEEPLPENGVPGEPGDQPSGETQGRRRKKRKRRS